MTAALRCAIIWKPGWTPGRRWKCCSAPSDGLLAICRQPSPVRRITIRATSPGAWSAESPASPVVVPGERIRLRAMCRNTTAQPQQVALDLAWEGAGEPARCACAPCGSRSRLSSSAPNLCPAVSGWPTCDSPRWRATMPRRCGPCRPGQQPVGDLATRPRGGPDEHGGTPVPPVVSELPLIAVRPWKQFAPYPSGCRASRARRAGFTMEPVRADPVAGIAGRPAAALVGNPIGGNFYSAAGLVARSLR